MTANNKDKRKRTKKSGAFKRLEQKRKAFLKKFDLCVCFVLNYYPECNMVDVAIVNPKDMSIKKEFVFNQIKIASPGSKGFVCVPILKRGDFGILHSGFFLPQFKTTALKPDCTYDPCYTPNLMPSSFWVHNIMYSQVVEHG